jgi:hypothetical protein
MNLRRLVFFLSLALVLRSSSACFGWPRAGPGEHCDWDVAFACEETRCTDGYYCSDTQNECVPLMSGDSHSAQGAELPTGPNELDSGTDAS